MPLKMFLNVGVCELKRSYENVFIKQEECISTFKLTWFASVEEHSMGPNANVN